MAKNEIKADGYYTDIRAHRYPGIARATLEMAYCNGGIHRERREADAIEELEAVLNAASLAADLGAISEWLMSLDKEQLSSVVDGEQLEMERAVASAPPGTDMLLNEIFDRAA